MVTGARKRNQPRQLFIRHTRFDVTAAGFSLIRSSKGENFGNGRASKHQENGWNSRRSREDRIAESCVQYRSFATRPYTRRILTH
jgi:hypothetical protein